MHIGHNVEKLRRYRRISQKDMAKRMEMDSKQYAELEESEEMPDFILQKVAAELDFDPDYIRWWMESGTTNIQNIHDNNIHDNGVATANDMTIGTQHVNPLDKIVELYERLLKAEQEKVALLEGRRSGTAD